MEIDELLNLSFEIEGLLTLMSMREDKTPQQVKNMLREKVDRLQSLVGGMVSDSETAASALFEEHEDADVQEAISVPEALPAQEPGGVEEDRDLPAAQSLAEPVPEPEPETQSVPQPLPMVPEPEISPESIQSPVTEKETTEERVNEIIPLPAQQEPEEVKPTIGEKVHAFTLNDKFRFRRELFGNSDSDFKEALAAVESMSSMAEAEDYFYNDLCWDPENEDVKDFMAIISQNLDK